MKYEDYEELLKLMIHFDMPKLIDRYICSEYAMQKCGWKIFEKYICTFDVFNACLEFSPNILALVSDIFSRCKPAMTRFVYSQDQKIVESAKRIAPEEDDRVLVEMISRKGHILDIVTRDKNHAIPVLFTLENFFIEDSRNIKYLNSLYDYIDKRHLLNIYMNFFGQTAMAGRDKYDYNMLIEDIKHWNFTTMKEPFKRPQYIWILAKKFKGNYTLVIEPENDINKD